MQQLEAARLAEMADPLRVDDDALDMRGLFMSDLISRKPNHELRISRRRAIALAGANPLPSDGTEIVIAFTRGKQKLFLANVGGEYWLRCDSCPREHWGLVFGVSGAPEADDPATGNRS